MAEIKNFGLSGVGPDLQFGKAGPRLLLNGSVFEARSADASAAANAISSNDVVVLSQLNALAASTSNAIANTNANAVTDGFHLVLGNTNVYGTGSWAGAVSLNNGTNVSSAVELLNSVLGKLVPVSPPSFPNGSLTVSSVGYSPVLASGVTDLANSGITAGTAVTRITGSVSSSNTFYNINTTNGGTLNLLLNNSVVGSHALTGTGDNGNYSGLVIAGEGAYPASTPGFWTAANISVSSATVSSNGVNSLQLTDTGAGSSNTVYFVKDSLVSVPGVTGAAVAQSSAGTIANSSSVPHYNSGAVLRASGSISNLAGQTYYNGNPLSVSATNSILTTQTFTYSGVGIATPIPQNTTAATAITPVLVNVNGTNVHTKGTLTYTAMNVNGSGSASPSTIVLVKNGTAPSTSVDEMSIPVTGLGSSPNGSNAARVGMANGDTPSNATTAWNQSAALQTYDAAVVAGVLSCNQTNYTTGYLPVGPNLSGQAATQYVTFSFNRTALSQFKINVTGSYAGCWISLPGVSDSTLISPNALGHAWWSMFSLYDGAGVPGGAGDSIAGCALGTAMAGATGVYTVTFGTQSSTNATGNTILVRFKLTAGQSITALSFTN